MGQKLSDHSNRKESAKNTITTLLTGLLLFGTYVTFRAARGSLRAPIRNVVTTTVRPPLHTAKVQRLVKKHIKTLTHFKTLEKSGRLPEARFLHFDWWMFPITRPSRVHGYEYTLSRSEIASLRRDPKFMRQYKQGVKLTFSSWNFDLEKGKQGFPILWDGNVTRLGKIEESLQELEPNMLENLNAFKSSPWVLDSFRERGL